LPPIIFHIGFTFRVTVSVVVPGDGDVAGNAYAREITSPIAARTARIEARIDLPPAEIGSTTRRYSIREDSSTV
jgi:hypothetical protein